MLKKSITFTDFNGNTVTEDHYFHLSKAELVEMEVSQEGGLYDYLQKIIKDEDGKAIIATFKKLILQAHGKISEDGRRFIKDWELSNSEFAETEAYSQLFMELVTDANAAAEFVNGIIPQGLSQEMQRFASKTEVEEITKPDSIVPQKISPQEAAVMDPRTLGDLLSSGQAVIE